MTNRILLPAILLGRINWTPMIKSNKIKHRFIFSLLFCMCLFKAHAQVKTVSLPPCGSLPTPAFTSQSVTVRSGTTADLALAWTNVGATSYKVFYKISNASQFSTSCTTSAVNCTIGGLLLGKTYNVRVEARRLCQFIEGEQDEDVTTSIIIQVTLPPSAPPAPVGLRATTNTLNTFVAIWSPADGATSYRLDVSLNRDFSSGNIFSDFSLIGSNKIVSGLLSGTTYFVRVRAVNASGTSDNSQVLSVTTLPSRPINLGSSSVTDTSFVATWSSVQSESATSYRLDVSLNNTFDSGNILTDFAVATPNKLVTGLVSGTTYFFRVEAFNISGVSGESQTFSVTTLSPALAPVITSFTPTSGPVGTVVTITGANFKPTPPTTPDNVVFFGATRATVTAATSTSLSVIVPFGATFDQISVTDISNHLTGYSARPFITTFTPAGQTLNSSSFEPKSTLSASNVNSIKTADLNRDGKPDMVVANGSSLSIYQNRSLRGSLDSSSFVLDMNIPFGAFPRHIIIEDFDSDGNPDILTSAGNGLISVFLNSSPAGAPFQFAGRFDFNTDHLISSLAVGDLDGNGRPDLAVTHQLPLNNGAPAGAVTVFHNNGGNSGFFSLPGVSFPEGLFPSSIAIGDLDNDLKPEMVTVDRLEQTVSIFKNISVKGSITPTSFAPRFAIVVPGCQDLAIGDIDGNGLQDLVVSGFNTLSVFDNIGQITFAQRVDYALVAEGDNLAISDLNGDAKPEIIVNGSVFQNTSAAGSGRSSFAQSVNYLPGLSFGSGTVAGDLDADGRPDIITKHDIIHVPTNTEYEIALLRNNMASDSIPNVFVINPAHGSTGHLPTVNVTANALAGASTYTIQLSTTNDFTTITNEKSGARGQQFTNLLYGTRYFARVKTNLSPAFGKTTSFSTVAAEDLAFVTSPTDGSIDQSPNVTVASNTVPGATQYTIELNTSPLFDHGGIVKTGNRIQSFTGLKYDTTYYSRVRTEFTQNWGETRSFTITDASKITFITSPADGATGLPTTLNLICSQVPAATEFTVIIRSSDSPLVDVFTSNSRTIRVSGLRPNALQRVQVRTNLSAQFGPERTFTTGAALGTLTAYPNPASNQVTIKNLKQGNSIKIVDALSGTLVETFRTVSEELIIDITKYRKGLYYVIPVNSDGSENEGLRLVVN